MSSITRPAHPASAGPVSAAPAPVRSGPARPAPSGTERSHGPGKDFPRKGGQDTGSGRTEVLVSIDRCTGCQECVVVCNSHALVLMPDTWAVQADSARCAGCRKCVSVCPFRAIEVTGPVRNRHRIVLESLVEELTRCCPPGWQVVESQPLLPPPGPGEEPVTPDLAVIRAPVPGVEWLTADGNPIGLVVEVVTSTTKARDLGPRRDLYWRHGIQTYWTIEAAGGTVTVQWTRPPNWFDPFARATFG